MTSSTLGSTSVVTSIALSGEMTSAGGGSTTGTIAAFATRERASGCGGEGSAATCAAGGLAPDRAEAGAGGARGALASSRARGLSIWGVVGLADLLPLVLA